MTNLVQRLGAASRLFHQIQHDAADALEAKDAEIAKYKVLCDQMGNALERCTKYTDADYAALAAWRNSK